MTDLSPADTINIQRLVAQALEIETKKQDERWKRVEEHMARVSPMIEAYELREQDYAVAARNGKKVLWVAGTIVAIGSAYQMIRSIFFS